ncbi:MAG TPA: hypothetical protein VGH28_27240 [Polyangiaceae bacterium]|jgi:hypothetical protein
MPYRDAIESVVQRCMDLRARIQRMEQTRRPLRACASLAEAVAWEAELRRRLAELEQLAAENEPIAPAVAQVRSRATTYSPLRTVVYFALVLATAIVFVVRFKR